MCFKLLRPLSKVFRKLLAKGFLQPRNLGVNSRTSLKAARMPLMKAATGACSKREWGGAYSPLASLFVASLSVDGVKVEHGDDYADDYLVDKVANATLGALAAWKQRRLVEALAAPPPHARYAFPHDAAFEPVDVLTPGAVRALSLIHI